MMQGSFGGALLWVGVVTGYALAVFRLQRLGRTWSDDALPPRGARREGEHRAGRTAA
jgi:hypothetical protein